MSFFEDLSPYSYQRVPSGLSVRNVGWLATGRPFSVGDVADEFLDRLWEYCKFPVMQTRGVNGCELCTPMNFDFVTARHNGETLELGSAEVWVFGGTEHSIFAAPDLIFHYVTEHGYRPPTVFIDAVLHGADPASKEYRNALADLNFPRIFDS